ncbi:hypothetical protein EV421DRAFT_1738887 [Armillaria borealis]|uniref:Uncharacterized protein n=1 Tax=Armillaria borealis TaxID=47425 RepID=A0AA39J8Z2_9AGAR|nr:hypothetical protein EV421DRAFT_1738887 [Armillaria borealis]
MKIQLELMDFIIDQVRDDVLMLSSCSLVSHDFYPRARLHSFHKITIGHPFRSNSSERFLHLLVASPHIRRLVRTIVVHTEYGIDEDGCHHTRTEPGGFRGDIEPGSVWLTRGPDEYGGLHVDCQAVRWSASVTSSLKRLVLRKCYQGQMELVRKLVLLSTASLEYLHVDNSELPEDFHKTFIDCGDEVVARHIGGINGSSIPHGRNCHRSKPG